MLGADLAVLGALGGLGVDLALLDALGWVGRGVWPLGWVGRGVWLWWALCAELGAEYNSLGWVAGAELAFRVWSTLYMFSSCFFSSLLFSAKSRVFMMVIF